jgi:hypothetical protein
VSRIETRPDSPMTVSMWSLLSRTTDPTRSSSRVATNGGHSRDCRTAGLPCPSIGRVCRTTVDGRRHPSAVVPGRIRHTSPSGNRAGSCCCGIEAWHTGGAVWCVVVDWGRAGRDPMRSPSRKRRAVGWPGRRTSRDRGGRRRRARRRTRRRPAGGWVRSSTVRRALRRALSGEVSARHQVAGPR